MFVASGHGLTAVKIPNIKAVIAGTELLGKATQL